LELVRAPVPRPLQQKRTAIRIGGPSWRLINQERAERERRFTPSPPRWDRPFVDGLFDPCEKTCREQA
jgi:hypothetical protein